MDVADDAVDDVDETDEVLEVMLALWRLFLLWLEASIVKAEAAAMGVLLSTAVADSSTRLLLWCCLLRSRRMVLIVPVLPTIIYVSLVVCGIRFWFV